jgi:hypothetical protein
MRYTKDCISEGGKAYTVELEAQGCERVLTALGYKSELDVEREARSRASSERLQKFLASRKESEGAEEDAAPKAVKVKAVKPGDRFYAYVDIDGQTHVNKYFGTRHMEKLVKRDSVAKYAGPCGSREEAVQALELVEVVQ